MAGLIDLPLQVLDHIFSFLDCDDVVAICFTCRKIYEVSQLYLKSVWDDPIYSLEEPKEDARRVLCNYDSLVGLWQVEIKPYGGLLQIKLTDGILLATLLLSPVNISEPLRKKTLFGIELQEDGSLKECYCQAPSKKRHTCQLGEIFENSFSSKCTDPILHNHPDGKQKEFSEWLCEELSPGNVPDQDLFVLKFLILDQYNNSFTYKRIDNPKNLPGAIIQPGLFKGHYVNHGVELIMLSYEENGMKMKGTKITGDSNVPACQVSISADLHYSLVLAEEEQIDIDKLMEIIPEIKEEPLEKLPQQAFVVPTDCFEPGNNVPKICRARFHGQGQIACYGFSCPSQIPGHWIVFDENNFGFLWLEMSLFLMYSRVTEKLD